MRRFMLLFRRPRLEIPLRFSPLIRRCREELSGRLPTLLYRQEFTNMVGRLDRRWLHLCCRLIYGGLVRSYSLRRSLLRRNSRRRSQALARRLFVPRKLFRCRRRLRRRLTNRSACRASGYPLVVRLLFRRTLVLAPLERLRRQREDIGPLAKPKKTQPTDP